MLIGGCIEVLCYVDFEKSFIYQLNLNRLHDTFLSNGNHLDIDHQSYGGVDTKL